MAIQYQGAGYDSVGEFMADTGTDKKTFADAQKNANTFGLKFKATFGPELNTQITEAQQRAKRLDAKPPVVVGVPNSFVYLFLLTGTIYLAYNLIFSSKN